MCLYSIVCLPDLAIFGTNSLNQMLKEFEIFAASGTDQQHPGFIGGAEKFQSLWRLRYV